MSYMKTIPLKTAHELIENAAAIIADHDALTYPSVSELTGEEDNEFLFIRWVNDEGLEFQIRAVEENNQSVKVTDQGDLVLVDDEGNEFEITLLKMDVVRVA